MERLATLFTGSFRQLKQVKTVTVCAMLGAVAIVLGSLSIELGSTLRIGFSGIPNELASMLFGPVVGGIMGGIGDILKFLIKPTGPYFFGYTLNAILGPVIYGIFFYHRPIQLGRVVAAKITVALLVNLLLGTWWLTILYGKGFLAILPARFIKQVVSVPIDSVIFYVIAKTLERSKAISMIKK